MTDRRTIKVLLMLMLIIIASERTYAGNPDSVYKKLPTLNNHTFIPFQDGQSPFISSYLKIGVGFAMTEDIELGTLVIDDNLIYTFDSNILFSNFDVEYQQRIKSWLAAYLRIKLSTRIGADLGTLFTEGINVVSGYDLGWLIKISEGKKHVMTANIQLSDYRATIINIQGIVSNIAEDTLMYMSDKIPAIFGMTGLRLAYAPNDLFGFGFAGDVGFGESFSREKSQFYWKLGITGEINLYSRTGIPLGIACNYTFNTLPSYLQLDNRRANMTSLRLDYTGANDYAIGLETAWGVVPTISSSDNLNALFVSLQMHLYF